MTLRTSLLIDGNAQGAIAAANSVERELGGVEQAARKAAAANDDLGARAVVSTGQARAGYLNLGRQAQDIAVQLQGGTNIGTIIAQQGGQVADAVAMMGGRFAGLASFLAGPWGAAIFLAASALVPFIGRLLESGEAAREAGNKYATAADQARDLIGAMNAAALNEARINRNKVWDELAGKENLLATGRRAGPNATTIYPRDGGFFAMGEQKAQLEKDIYGLRLKLAEEDNKIAIAERENRRIEQSARGRSGPRAGSGASAGSTRRQLQDLDTIGERAAEKITRISEQFDEQPRLIDRVNAATRELDKTIAELKAKNKNGIFDKEIAQAEAAKLTVREALVRPLEEARQESERRLQVQTLTAAGMDAEAEALERIWRFEQQNYKMSAAQKQEVLDRVRYEREVSAELQRRRGLIEGYLDTTRSIKQELTSIFSGTGSAGNLASIGRQLNSQMLVEKIFGSAFKDLDDWVKGQSGLKPSIDYFSEEATRGGKAVGAFAAAVNAAADGVRNAGAPKVESAGASGADANEEGKPTEIVVTAPRDSVFGLVPREYFDKLGGTMAGAIVDALNEEFSTTFFNRLKGTLGGAISGYLLAGPLGAVLGGARGLMFDYGKDIFGEKISDKILGGLEKSLKGIETGMFVSGVANAFGIKMNSGGAQLGGALGGALSFIPGGSIIGSIAGGLLGNLFGKRPRGAGSVSNTGVTASANDAGITGSLNETGSNLQGAIAQIANALGASVGNYSIGIGRYKDYYQVSSAANDARLGNSYFGRDSKSALYDGLDPAAAMRAAIAGAISQGAIEGLSDAMQKALRSSTDIDAAIKEALKVREVETLIGGIGKALEEQFKSFERQAAERLRIARQYGFDVAKIEELNARERAKLVKDLLADQVGSLQQLIEDMTSGSLFEGSAVDRRQALLAQIAEAKAAADAGTEGAADRLAQLLSQLNAVSRDVYGTTGGFATDRSTILDSARDTIAKANQRIADAQAASDPALTQTNAALEENNDQNAQILAAIGTTNDQLAQILAQSQAGGTGGLAGLALTSGVDWR